jgi:hypothetical protein
LNFSEAPFTYGIHTEVRGVCSVQTTATLRFNNRVKETLGITVELEITPQASDFIEKTLSFLADGGSSIVQTLKQTSSHTRRMVGVEVEISVSVGGSPADFVGQCRLFPDDQNIQKRNHSDSVSIVNWMEEGLELLRCMRKFWNRSGP